MTTVNWNDLQTAAGDAGFDPVPPNDYDVVVDSAVVKQAGTGKNMISCQFKIENGPYAGKSIWNQFVISPESPNALAFFFRHMAAMGLNQAYFDANPPLERVAADLVGRRCMVKVSIRQWQGSDRNQVDAVAPPQNGVAPAPAPTVGNVAAPGVPSPGKPAASPAPAPAPVPGGAPAPSVSSPPRTAAAPPPPPQMSGLSTNDEEMPF